jgi:hypothetical protein
MGGLMTTQPHFPRMPTLSIVSILLIIAGAALCPVFASSFKGETKAERYVLSQLHNGETAEFFPDTIPKANRTLTAAFIEKLLTGGYKQVGIKPNQSLLMADWMTYPGISIRGAVITGDLKLIGQEVSYDLWLLDCTFEGFVELTDSRFAKRLIFTRSRFEGPVSFFGATIGLDLHAENSHFADGATFNGMRVGRNFRRR